MNRTTTIYHFNPTCEMAVANGSPYYMAPALLREFEEELASIMLFFSTNDDIIIKEKPLSGQFIQQLANFCLPSPKFMQRRAIHNFIEERKRDTINIQSWGKSPAESYFIRDIFSRSELVWEPEWKALFERDTSLLFLKKFLNNNRSLIFPESDDLPIQIKTIEDVEKYMNQWGKIVLKAPLSSSGRGLQIIRKQQINQSHKQWIENILKQQNYLIVERWYEKSVDFSYQFLINEKQEVKYLGPSFFITNANGQYAGHYLNFTLWNKLGFTESEINQIGNLLCEELAESMYAKLHHGFIGIDGLIYRDRNELKIHPCLEINARYNMGILSKFIEKQIHPESSGNFQIYYHPRKSYSNFENEQSKINPPVIKNQQIIKGFLSLTSPNFESKFGAYLELQ